ncbi:MAG: DUF1552 domain-containing protein [Pseudomonadota bacterium]
MRYKDCFDKERRDFMRVVKHAGISAGVLRASSLVAGVMLARTADAQTPTKHCLVFSGGGCHPDKWFPSGSTLPIQSAPLQTHYGKMVLMRNASLSAGGHGQMPHRFNNASYSSDSFDVNMGRTIGSNYPHKYINVGNVATSGLSREGYAEKTTLTSPQAVLDTYFSGGGGGGGTGTPPRKSIVDLHFATVNDLKTKLGQHEKDKLDSHFTAIREIETTLTDTNPNPVGTCSPLPSTGGVLAFDALAKLQTDIIVLALSCNLTASVSIAFGNDSHEYHLDVLGRSSHLSHHNQAQMPNAYSEDIAYMQGLTKNLFDKLNAKGLLSSTIVTQISDMGDANGHGNTNVPMLVGGAGISGGRVMDIGGKTQTDIYHTLALKLRANESQYAAAYRNWGGSVISGL